jgi:hypothetical protein
MVPATDGDVGGLPVEQLTLELEEHDLRALKRAAANEGATIEEVAQRAIHEYLATRVAPDPEWQRRFDEIIARIQSRIPPEITPEEIEADVSAARAEVREAQRASGR